MPTDRGIMPYYLFVAEKPSVMKEVKSTYEKHYDELRERIGLIDFVALSGHVCCYYEPDQYDAWKGKKWREIPLPMIPIPFYYSNEVGFLFHLTEVIYNCLFFLPFGIYLKAIMNTGYSKQIVLFGVVFSIALEAVQYIFAIGATDVTDVITNTCGVTVGIYSVPFF